MSKNSQPKFTVHSTKDYSVFKIPNYQRDVNQSAVKKLAQSIKAEGQLQAVTVDVSGTVIDGQHRLEALKSLKMPVWYCINHDLGKKDTSNYACKTANNVSNKWSIMSYVNWAKRNGNDVVAEAEAIAKDWSKTTNNKLTVALALDLLNKSNSGTKASLDSLSYKLNYDTAKNVYDVATLMEPYVVGNPFSARIIRPLKILSQQKGGLDLKVAEKMCQKKHVRIFNTQKENYDFIKELYEKYE